MATKTKEQPQLAANLKHGISLNTYLPFEKLHVKDALERIATQESRSTSEITVMALEAYIDKQAKKK